MEKFDFGKVVVAEKAKKQETAIPEGMVSEKSFTEKLTAYFEGLDDIQTFRQAVKANFVYEPGLTGNQATYKSRRLKSVLNLFNRKFKIFVLKSVPNKRDQNKIIDFELIQLVISLEDKAKIDFLLALQSEGIFSVLHDLTYESLKAEVLSFEKRKKEMILAAEAARKERERVAKIEDEIRAIETALITLKLHKLPVKELTGKLQELRQSIAV